MIDTYDNLYSDFEAVRKIPIVSMMLEVICNTTGMGFAAIARVTDTRWLACGVRDEINFGLEAGGELKLESTICNEIRGDCTAVIIDHVNENEKYINHHTPKTYGFQSYISFPIVLKNGDFFGTLCAIDPRPAQLDNPKIIGMFTMFAELISFHLQSLELLERNHVALHESNRQLNYTHVENVQYQRISNHNLQEPLRKISMYSDILVNKAEIEDMAKTKKIAKKINNLAEQIRKMIGDITDFSALEHSDTPFENVDLNGIITYVVAQLGPKLKEKNTTVESGELPSIFAIPQQMAQLLLRLVENAIPSETNDAPAIIHVYTKVFLPELTKQFLPPENSKEYCEICIENRSAVNDGFALENAFDIFVHSKDDEKIGKYDAGLAFCRKIVHNHSGVLTAKHLTGNGICFSIVLPIEVNTKQIVDVN